MENKEIKIKLCNPTSKQMTDVSIFPWNQKGEDVVTTSETEGMTIGDIRKFFQDNNFDLNINVKYLKVQSMFFVSMKMRVDELYDTITPYLDPDTKPEDSNNGDISVNGGIRNKIGGRFDLVFDSLYPNCEVLITIKDIANINNGS
jgi:hypothetical protein